MANSPETASNWREKYLNALDAHEKTEKELMAKLALLRKTIVRVSVIADGQNEGLDQTLGQLREIVRGDLKNVPQLEELTAYLEQQAITLEHDQLQTTTAVKQALLDILEPLQHYKLSLAIKQDINSYIAGLAKQLPKNHLCPMLLRELAVIQQRAWAELKQPKISFFERILPAKPSPQRVEISSPVVDKPHTQTPINVRQSHSDIKTPDTPKYLSAELTPKITQVIFEFLNSLENETSIRTKIASVRQKLNEGLDSNEIVPTLELIRDLMMEAYLAANQAFTSYLNGVNCELAEITNLIGGAMNQSDQEAAASRELHDSMTREMDQLHTQTLEATDLNQLKNQVQSQLGKIRRAIDQHQNARASENPLSQQLLTLSEKIQFMESEVEKTRSTLDIQRYKATHDALTNLPNREAYHERGDMEFQRWLRYQRPLSLAIIDIDHFKRVNDNHGHQAGDQVIKLMGEAIAQRLREVDFFCRYGGEEFVALFPETDSSTALKVLETIRLAIANAKFNYKHATLAITFSAGISEAKPGDTLESLLERADRALYTAKEAGRNICKLF